MTDGTERGQGRHTESTRHVVGDLVVDSDHAPRVLELLTTARIAETIPALGLTLVTVDDVEAALTLLPDPDPDPDAPSSGEADLMDELLSRLRAAAAARWSGWFPIMGKNRIVLGPQAYPYVSPKDDPGRGPQPASTSPTVAPGAGVEGLGLTVGLLDTRVIRHPFFSDAVDFVGDSETESARVNDAWQAHGTFVTGLVHAHAPAARILVRSILTGDGGAATAWEAAKGLVNLVQLGADVVNMSFGCVTVDHRPPFAIRAAVERLRDRVVLVAAAGNYDAPLSGGEPVTPPSWPAALDGVLAVGAEDEPHVRCSFSPEEPWVDLAADGRDLLSTFAGNNQKVSYELRNGTVITNVFTGAARWSGTSFASAIVAGRIAALASTSGYPYTGIAPGALAKQLRDARYPQDPVARRP
jgi:membrane-anchored mycosin MYCP